MELGLIQKQTTQLVMTTQLRQAISILQYSTLELLDYIKEEALENPLIELHTPSWDTGIRAKAAGRGERADSLDYVAERGKSLNEELHEQVRCLNLCPHQAKVIHYLIDNIDEAGYLRIRDHEVIMQFQLTNQEYEEAVRVLQSLEPGIGGRNLAECLSLQLRSTSEVHTLARKLVNENLKALAEKKFRELSKEYHVKLQDIQLASDVIAALDPRPGSKWYNEKPYYVAPDIIIKENEGTYTIKLLDDELPSMKVSTAYQSFEKGEVGHYIKGKYQQVNWLMKSIEQRKHTLRSIMTVFIGQQTSFLQTGLSELRPITLKEVANEAGVHESTVSRAIKNKYVQTPQGLYALKDLFTSRLSGETETGTSSSSVKIFIKEFVEEEDKKKPLSDQKIVEALHIQKGIQVSRRTIAKYREELGIPGSSRRKRFV
ncbi:RNA polymerase factor sigma-54 [Alkalihalobacillus sp. CinArs1]|uniref:RNA polymerase factor sigma-54 n=1 Tax=Alkalihalobacillus sp. CinArs1 TaxID=2995314 RepID=UPI0022DE066C|nr:RNA polymerase factor sigma-54 [Alkalihalobacillus sp. CinArs1]